MSNWHHSFLFFLSFFFLLNSLNGWLIWCLKRHKPDPLLYVQANKQNEQESIISWNNVP